MNTDLAWALFGLAIWFWVGWQAVKSIKRVVESDKGKKTYSSPGSGWTTGMEWLGRVGILGGAVTIIVALMVYLEADNLPEDPPPNTWF